MEEVRRMFAGLVTGDTSLQRRLLDPAQGVSPKAANLAKLLARALDLWIQMHRLQRRRDSKALQKLHSKFARAEDDFMTSRLEDAPALNRRQTQTDFSILCDKVTEQLRVNPAELKAFLKVQSGRRQPLAG